MLTKVLVIGSGVFGLSSAIELKNRNYEVTVFDAYEVPSPWAASNDLNKVIRATYANETYCKMALEAISIWKLDPIYEGCFFNSGKVQAIGSNNNKEAGASQRKAIENLKKYGGKDRVITFKNGQELGTKFPMLSDNKLGTGSIDYALDSGYALASKAISRAYEKCKSLGVEFIIGERGKIIGFDNNSVTNSLNEKFTGDKILLCAGAANGYLVDLEDQVRALGEFVAHVELNQEEYQLYKDMPIVHKEEGFFFPPDETTHQIKLVVQNMRALNSIKNPIKYTSMVSLPNYGKSGKSSGIPLEAENTLRDILKVTIPSLKDKPFTNCVICWCGNTFDMNWIIDKVPGYESAYICGGDSGHGFKFLPNVGKYVVDIMEGTSNKELCDQWRWKSFPTWPEKWPAGCPNSTNKELDDFK